MKEQKPLLVLSALALAALCAGLALWIILREAEPEDGRTSGHLPPDRALSEKSVGATKAPAARKPDPIAVAAVAAEVERRQREASGERKRFEAEGWTLVETEPPDTRVAGLDPDLLSHRERELREQLETGPLRDDLVDRTRVIATRASEERTRIAAIEALGRARTPRAQAELRGIFDELTSERERRAALGVLRPKSLGDETAAWLYERLGAVSLSDDLKKQMTFSLVLAWFLETKGQVEALPALTERAPAAWREALLATYRQVAGQ
jgi:hypothetical protein